MTIRANVSFVYFQALWSGPINWQLLLAFVLSFSNRKFTSLHFLHLEPFHSSSVKNGPIYSFVLLFESHWDATRWCLSIVGKGKKYHTLLRFEFVWWRNEDKRRKTDSTKMCVDFFFLSCNFQIVVFVHEPKKEDHTERVAWQKGKKNIYIIFIWF